MRIQQSPAITPRPGIDVEVKPKPIASVVTVKLHFERFATVNPDGTVSVLTRRIKI